MNENKELISVIVPAYNCEKTIKKCLKSIINQTYNKLEVIVINDGSTDGTSQAIKSIKDERIRLIYQDNKGVSEARNTGLKESNGQLIGFVDADDYIDSDMYRMLYENMKEFNSDIASCSAMRVNISGEKFKLYGIEYTGFFSGVEAVRENYKNELSVSDTLWNKLFKRELFSNITFPTNRIYEDACVFYRLLFLCSRYSFTDYVGYYYVNNENSITNSKFCEKNFDKVICALEKHLFIKNQYPELICESNNQLAFQCRYFIEAAIKYNHNSVNSLVQETRVIMKTEVNFNYLSRGDKIYYILIRRMYILFIALTRLNLI